MQSFTELKQLAKGLLVAGEDRKNEYIASYGIEGIGSANFS